MSVRLLAALAAAFLVAMPARADDPLDAAHGSETTLFRSLLRYAGVTPIESMDEFERHGNNLDDVVVVMIGPPPLPRQGWKSGGLLDRVYPSGGAVLVSTHDPSELGRYFAPNARVAVNGFAVHHSRPNATTCLGGVRSRPFLATGTDPIADPFLLKILPLRRVAVDLPSAFVTPLADGGAFTAAVLKYPTDCVYLIQPGFSLEVPTAVLSVRARHGEHAGVGVVLPSSGTLTNRMLTAKDTDNFAFAYYLTKHLVTSRPDGRWRTKCLFLEDGKVRTDFDAIPLLTPQVPPVLPPAPPVPSLDELQDKIVDAANAALADAQNRDAIGGPVADNFDKIMKVVGPTLAALALVFFLHRAWAGRHRGPETAGPKPGPELSPFDLRRKAALQQYDIGGPVREYLRDLFAGWGAAGGGELPPVRFDRPREDRKITDRLRTLWGVAYGAGPLLSERWGELQPMVVFLSKASAAGKWRFARAGGGA